MKEIAELKKNEIPEFLSPQTAPTNGSMEISELKISCVVDLKVVGESWKSKQESQRSPVEAGQESSDVKVSIFCGSKYKGSVRMNTFSQMSAFIAHTEQLSPF